MIKQKLKLKNIIYDDYLFQNIRRATKIIFITVLHSLLLQGIPQL